MPEVKITLPNRNSCEAVLYPAGVTEFDEVVLEQRLGGIIPDIMVRKGDSWLLIEIFVTHKVDNNKLKLIKEEGVSTVEINLSTLENMPAKEELKNMLLTSISPIYWLFNKRRSYYWDKWLKCCAKMPIVERGLTVHVDNCPIQMRKWHGKYYANLFDDC